MTATMLSVVALVALLPVAVHCACTPPTVDLLFVIDGTVNVGRVNFEKIKDFAIAYARTMVIGVRDSRVGLAQFTPQKKAEIKLVESIDIDTLVRLIDVCGKMLTAMLVHATVFTGCSVCAVSWLCA